MSVLSAQCDELREKAKLLRIHVDGLSAPYIVPSTKELMAITMVDSAGRMEDAADTIESLRDRLQADVLGSGTCEFTIEYDRDEVERRRKMYEENPLGLFPQDMPKSAWTCSNCGQQFKCHYDRRTGKLLPVPDWMKCCPSCGRRIRKAVKQ